MRISFCADFYDFQAGESCLSRPGQSRMLCRSSTKWFCIICGLPSLLSLSLSAPLSSSALLTLFPSLFPFGIHKKSMHAKCFRDTLKLVRLLLLPLFLLLLLLPPLFVYSSNGGANRKNYVDESSVNGIYFIVTYVNCYLCHTHRASIMTSCRLNSIRFHFPYFLFFTVMLLEYLWILRTLMHGLRMSLLFVLLMILHCSFSHLNFVALAASLHSHDSLLSTQRLRNAVYF